MQEAREINFLFSNIVHILEWNVKKPCVILSSGKFTFDATEKIANAVTSYNQHHEVEDYSEEVHF